MNNQFFSSMGPGERDLHLDVPKISEQVHSNHFSSIWMNGQTRVFLIYIGIAGPADKKEILGSPATAITDFLA
jgi:hypothetical protein